MFSILSHKKYILKEPAICMCHFASNTMQNGTLKIVIKLIPNTFKCLNLNDYKVVRNVCMVQDQKSLF